MPTVDEFQVQRALILWLTGNPDKSGTPRTTPALAPGVEFWHTPNGGERRDAFEGKRLREMGVQAGIPDLLFLRPTQFTEGVFGLLFGLELKRPRASRTRLEKRDARHVELRNGLVARGYAERTVDMLSDSQLEMHPRLIRAGLAASCVVDNLADAKEFCRLHRLVRC
jgi:hypothetical protein